MMHICVHPLQSLGFASLATFGYNSAGGCMFLPFPAGQCQRKLLDTDHQISPTLECMICASNRSTFFSRSFIPARTSSRLPVDPSWLARFNTERMASRVKSETLRAPVSRHTCLSAAYSSSDKRTLIMRERRLISVITGLYSWQDAGDAP